MRWLFLRGLVREARHWGDFPERFCSALGDAGVVGPPLTLDLPGMGTECGGAIPGTVAGFVDDLRGRLQTVVAPGEPLGLFAVSLGGMVALDWLSRFPGDFGRAVIVATSAGDLSNPFERFHPRNYPRILRALRAPPEERERIILAITSNREDGGLEAVAARHAAYARERPSGPPVLFRQLRAGMRSRTPERLLVPTLFLASRADRLVDWRCSERIAARFAAPLRLHERAGHDLPLDAPDWILAEVRAFLQGGVTSDPAAAPDLDRLGAP